MRSLVVAAVSLLTFVGGIDPPLAQAVPVVSTPVSLTKLEEIASLEATGGEGAKHRAGESQRELAYDLAGRIEALADEDGGQTWGYGYDDLDRLTAAANAAASGPTASLNLNWNYDATGNRTQETRNGTATAYTLDDASNRLASVGTQNRQYDAAGNTVQADGRTSIYGGRNRLVELRTGVAPLAQYAYNAFGERICKAVNGACPSQQPGTNYTQFVYDEEGHLLGEYDAAGNLIAEHLWLEDTPIAVLKPQNSATTHGGQSIPASGAAPALTAYFVHPDHLDTPRIIVNANDETVWRWDSAPFGDTDANENPSNLGAFAYHLRFPGQYFDQESGQHYNYYRDYEPATGRYVQSDPIGLLSDFASFNYSGSDPASYFDPSGLSSKGVARNAKAQLDAGCGASACNPVKIVVPDNPAWGAAMDHAIDTEGGNTAKPRPLDRDNTDARRSSRMKGCKCKPNMDRDEWPPAFQDDLGGPTSVRSIGFKPNRGLGGYMGRACSFLPNGTWVQWVFSRKSK